MTQGSEDPTPEIVFDAALVAQRLGLSPDRFLSELHRGIVYHVAERGAGADEGRYRVTFRYRARQCRFVIAADGRILDGH